MIGALVFEFLFTQLFLWLIKKFRPLTTGNVRLVAANTLSLSVYTVAMGYSLLPDLTKGDPPRLGEAFRIGILPQLVCLAYGLIRANVFAAKGWTETGMDDETAFEVVARSAGFDTPIATAPLFYSREKAEAWAAKYGAENPELLKKGDVTIAVREQPPQQS